jgi:dihydropyrimidinase
VRARAHRPESIEATQAQVENACYCDYGFHLTLMGEVPTPHFGQLADAMQDGHASIKIFTTNIRPGNSAAWCRTATSGRR